MSNRLSAAALKPLSRRNAPSARLRACPQRQFSSTPAHGFRAVFNESRNSELGSVLDDIQKKIIFPAYLPEKQRRMIFNPKMRSHLEQNPIVIEVEEGLQHKFTPIDRFKEWEDPRKLFIRALDKMQSKQDWRNLKTLLAGYKRAGIELPADVWGKIVRKAAKTGNILAVIACAKQADQTGFVLTRRETVVRIFADINDKMIVNKKLMNKEMIVNRWVVWQTRLAVKAVDVVLDLLHRPEHSLPGLDLRDRLHCSRLVHGLILFTKSSAVKIKRWLKEDDSEQVRQLRDQVSLFRSLWKDALPEHLTQIEELAALNPTLEKKANPGGPRVPTALNNYAYVQVMAQVMKGISLTKYLLGDEAADLMPVRDALDKHLNDFVQTLPGELEEPKRGYKRVARRWPDWTDDGVDQEQSS